jgi:hypothetical protein
MLMRMTFSEAWNARLFAGYSGIFHNMSYANEGIQGTVPALVIDALADATSLSGKTIHQVDRRQIRRVLRHGQPITQPSAQSRPEAKARMQIGHCRLIHLASRSQLAGRSA